MENKATSAATNTFSAILTIAFLIGLAIFEFSLYSYLSHDGSPWLYLFAANALYLIVSFFIIGGLSMLGGFGLMLGYIVAIAGLYVIGIGTLTL